MKSGALGFLHSALKFLVPKIGEAEQKFKDAKGKHGAEKRTLVLDGVLAGLAAAAQVEPHVGKVLTHPKTQAILGKVNDVLVEAAKDLSKVQEEIDQRNPTEGESD